jgi:protein-L-isoaspartate O-methyltransferase
LVITYSWADAYRTYSGPYDAIHVGAAAPTLPQPLVDQLAKPGRMFIPVGTNTQAIIQVDKDDKGEVMMKEIMGVMVRHLPSSESYLEADEAMSQYVPLTDKPTGKI